MDRLLIVILVLAALLLQIGCVPRSDDSDQVDGNTLVFGEVVINLTENTLRFSAVVRREQGWVQHLLHLDGYQWLREQSALVSSAQLSDLQKGFAALDWMVWDSLWQGIDSKATRAVQVFVQHGGRKVPAVTLVDADDALYIGDLIFLGCPYFDVVALAAASAVDCTLCPLFPLEQEALGKRFVREGGESGFTLNPHTMFPQGREVEIIIKLP